MASGGTLDGFQGKVTNFPDKSFNLSFSESFKKSVPGVVGTTLFPTPPSSEDVAQGRFGDCYLLTALMGLADTNPDLLLGMMKDTADGHVVVKLYDHRNPIYFKLDKTFVVSGMFFKKTAFQNHKALWVYMIEKAYVAFRIREANIMKEYYSRKEINDTDSAKQYAGKLKLNFQEQISGNTNAIYDVLTGNTMTFKNTINISPQDCLVHVLSATRDKYASMSKYSKDELDLNLNEVFGLHPKLKEDFIDKNKFDLSKNFNSKFPSSDFNKSEEIINFIDNNIKNLEDMTRNQIVSYIKSNFSQKRGRGLYTVHEEAIFKGIVEAFIQNKSVSASTRSSVKKDQTSCYKGLAPSHMYQVTLAFRETRTNLIFIKLRNPWKTHVRDYSFKDKDGFAVLSPEQADQMTKGHWLEAKAGGFKPGEFVVELSDFAKRFDAINYM